MNRIRLLLVVLGACCMAESGTARAAVAGEPAPNVLLPFVDGRSAELSEWLGRRPVYLKMWATWCSTCRAEMPHFREAFETYGDEIAFFSVNAGFNDAVADVRAFNREYGLSMPSVIDAAGDIGQAFELIATPYHILIDASGQVVHTGHAANDTVDRLLARLAREADAAAVRPAAEVGKVVAPVEPRIGDPAPPFAVETLSGESFGVGGAASNEPVYLLFFTTWCEPYLSGEGDDRETAAACRQTRRAIVRAFAESARPPTLVGIASRMWTGPGELAEYRERHAPPYPLALDETNAVFRSYGVRRFPTLVTIEGGRVTGRFSGALEEFPPSPGSR